MSLFHSITANNANFMVNQENTYRSTINHSSVMSEDARERQRGSPPRTISIVTRRACTTLCRGTAAIEAGCARASTAAKRPKYGLDLIILNHIAIVCTARKISTLSSKSQHFFRSQFHFMIADRGQVRGSSARCLWCDG